LTLPHETGLDVSNILMTDSWVNLSDKNFDGENQMYGMLIGEH